jgi:phosphoglycolate phosphatase
MNARHPALRGVDAVLFDFDDTIVAARSHRENALVAMIESAGRTPVPGGFDRAYGRTFQELIAAVDPGADFASFLDAYSRYIEEHPAALLPGVRALIRKLSEEDRLLGIVSTSNTRLIRAELRAHSLERHFEYVAGEDSLGPRKPDPGVLSHAGDTLAPGRGPEHILYIGDSLVDLTMARAAGCSFVGVCTGAISAAEFRDEGLADHAVVDDLSQLIS